MSAIRPDVILRPAAAGDLSDLLLLYRDLNPADPPLAEEAARRAFETMLAQPGLTLFLAETDGEVLATATLIVIPNLTRGARPYGLIENVVTRASRRGTGFGEAVVRHAIAEGFAADCYKIMLLTGRQRDEVHRFYERCGFVQNKTGFQIRND